VKTMFFQRALLLLLFVLQTCLCCSRHGGGERGRQRQRFFAKQNVIVFALLTDLSSVAVWRDVGNDDDVFNKLMLLLCVLRTGHCCGIREGGERGGRRR